ncbi:30S ribosomal protein S5 [Candidatus Peregrinibacteria bacterium CG22_combo_CG10-13_8_21_14_all_44_10]|nr:MAG: 30S ribosomal protein S5 [Candidatus Peregrinibacteria bacterium CG2_30_44_17]PIP66067.1 MAG: 30S ribosomal protein S5 [Candidatus Peregrinibacteria bacterium CG22_combo_CG10-13_8_21_14_all_44_10]PIS03617.1 MAG: 30S ribosomal protein S5 [Candidatus Peregrinibacteria bacterium CG10_big_fil_rev_8_21_14_0_10_44_7]PIX78879.1 MAG: 30S ribosomal protein S5 [Candidatus Peregrinibacteria bacterium CG_4_10_14_3_um_filter_44_21]PJB88870.1 MAG: 30S ribosomal protein S5 [Candidatus Peregrinibacteri
MAKKPFNKRGAHKEVKEFEEEVIQIDRVTRVVKGGRRLRFRATVAIGNKKGKIGVGIGKSVEVQGAIKKAVAKAKKDLVEINMYGETIPHRIESKFKSAKVLLIPAGEGTGIIAGGPVRKVVELAGIKNILSKSLGSNNKLNCVKATYKALASLRFREGPKKAAEPVKAVQPEATAKVEEPKKAEKQKQLASKKPVAAAKPAQAKKPMRKEEPKK